MYISHSERVCEWAGYLDSVSKALPGPCRLCLALSGFPCSCVVAVGLVLWVC